MSGQIGLLKDKAYLQTIFTQLTKKEHDMRQFYNRLLQGGCVLALTTGLASLASAQSGLLEVGGTKITNNGGFGGNVKAWIPFGVFGAYLEGGVQDKDPFADLGFGARFMVGNNLGIGSLLTFDLQKGESNKLFYAIKPTLEVGLGGFTLSSTVQIPVGKKERTVEHSGSAQGQLRNQPGSTQCSNPTNTDTKVCDLWLVGREKSTEQNRFGVNFNAQYELNLGGFSITPNVGVYVYDRQGKNLVGVHGGAKVGFGFGNGMAIEGAVDVRRDNKNNQYENNHRTQAVFTAGLTWHFGGGPISGVTRFVDRAPVRTVFDRGLRTQERLGNSFEERARLKDSVSNAPVSAVRFVDVFNQATAHTKIGNLAQNEIIIVQGDVQLANNQGINMVNSFTGVIGGNANVAIVGVNSGHEGNFHTPGTRGRLLTAGTVTDVFTTNMNLNNIILQGVDIVGGANVTRGILFINNVDNVRVRNVSVTNVKEQTLLIKNGSDHAIITDYTGTVGGTNDVSLISADNVVDVTFERITLSNMRANANGLRIVNTNGAVLKDIDVSDNNTDSQFGIDINNSQNVMLDRANIRNAGLQGIRVNGAGTNTINLKNVSITASTNTLNGILIDNGADNVFLTNFSLLGTGTAGARGVRVNAGSTNITFQNVHAENWQVGFELRDNTTSIVDLGGNTFTAVGMQSACDSNAMNVVGGINVTTTNTGVATLCR